MYRIILALSLGILFCGCYSFKGISIPPEVNTFLVEDFSITARNVPPNAGQLFAEALRQRVRNETRLVNQEVDPDITFEGKVTYYSVESVAPQADNTVALNKFKITVEVEYTSRLNEDDNWKQSFSFFRDFDSTIDFYGVEDAYREEIYNQLTENIFNKAFTNW